MEQELLRALCVAEKAPVMESAGGAAIPTHAGSTALTYWKHSFSTSFAFVVAFTLPTIRRESKQWRLGIVA